MLTRRALLLTASAAAVSRASEAEAAFAIFQTYPVNGTQPAFSSVAYNSLVTAGEQGLAISVANDGTTVYTPNSSGPWLWNGSSWQRLATPSTMPAGSFNTTGGPSAGEAQYCAVAPSNSQYMIMMWGGKYYYTSNQGGTWAASSLTYSQAEPNDVSNPLIQFDPVNPAKAIACVPGTGAYYSTNSGQTWTQITGLAASADQYTVCFDPNSSTGGSTPGIYIGVDATGVYHTTGGLTGTFTLTSSGPTGVFSMCCSSDGYLYVASGYGANSTCYIYNGSAWSTGNTNGSGSSYDVVGFCADPNTTGRVVALEVGGGRISISTNHGSTWNGWTANLTQLSISATDVPWLDSSGLAAGITATGYTGCVFGVFHPTLSNTIYVAAGTGFYYINPPTSNLSSTANLVWNSKNTGLGMLDAFQIISPPGIHPYTAQWDRAVFPVYPVPGPAQIYNPNDSGGSLYQGFSIDYAPGTSFIAGLTQFVDFVSGADEAGYSLDGGQTWNVFSGNTQIPNVNVGGGNGGGWGGCIAVSTPSNIIRVQAQYGSNPLQIYYTTNQGANWSLATGTGLPSSNWKQNYYDQAQILAADKVNTGQFYALDSSGNVWKSTTNGSTFANVGTVTSYNGVTSDLKAVPGNANHLFHCGCGGNVLSYSTNAGAAWSNISNVTGVYAYGFGAPYPGNTYPTVYIAGEVSSVYGIWRGVGNSPSSLTWTNLTQAAPAGYPAGTGWVVYKLSGDMSAFGWFYIGWQISGYLYGVSNDAAPWGTFTSPAQNATITGTINLTVSVAADIACTSVQFQVDGSNTGSPVTPSGGSATLSYNTSGLAGGGTPHTFSAILSGNGQTTTVNCYVTK